MATSEGMPATMEGTCGTSAVMSIWQSLTQRVVPIKVVLPLVYLSPYLMGLLKQNWQKFMEFFVSSALSFMIWIMLS